MYSLKVRDAATVSVMTTTSTYSHPWLGLGQDNGIWDHQLLLLSQRVCPPPPLYSIGNLLLTVPCLCLTQRNHLPSSLTVSAFTSSIFGLLHFHHIQFSAVSIFTLRCSVTSVTPLPPTPHVFTSSNEQ